MNTNINQGKNQTTFWESLTIQRRVIHALFMREIITRYGRHNIGFLWLFVEPMIFTLGVTALWTATKAVHGGDLPIVGFALTGYSSILLWRNVAMRCGKAIEANAALLFHRNVKIFDIVISRALLEIIGASISFIVLGIIFTALGFMDMPVDIFKLLMGWILTAWFALSLGLVIACLSEASELFDRLWHAFTYLLFPLSGAGFLVDWLPEKMQQVVLLLPMVHGTEMMRHGFYGDKVITYENPTYMITMNLIFTFIGLLWIKDIGKKVVPE